MNRKNLFGLLAILMIVMLVLTACQPAAQQQGAAQEKPADKEKPAANDKVNLSVSGAFAIYPMMVRWAEEYQKIYPNVQIDVSAGGAGKGMSDALAGMVDIGMVSREIKPEEVSKGAYDVAIARDAVFPTANANNPVLKDLLAHGITKEVFKSIFIDASIKTWGEAIEKADNTDAINVYTRSDACGAAEVWVKFCGGSKQEELQGIGVSSDPGIVDAIKKDPAGIGYNNLNYAFDNTTGKPVEGIIIVPIDLDGNGKIDDKELLDTKEKAVNAVATGLYPEPPARLEHLVTKGKPSGATLEFLNWIMNDGQKYLSETGYVPLPAENLEKEKGKLK